jgi:hypothetical protein
VRIAASADAKSRFRRARRCDPLSLSDQLFNPRGQLSGCSILLHLVRRGFRDDRRQMLEVAGQ